MITGAVNAQREATIRLDLHGSDGHVQAVDAVIDTGFSGTLTLPFALVTSLELPFVCQQHGTLADGSTQLFDVYEGTVLWDGQPRLIEMDASETAPLVGMELMNGFELNVQIRPGGSVSLKTMP